MFGLFRKKSRLVRDNDQVYLTRELADAALVRDAVGLLGLGAPVIVASFFEGSLERMAAAFAAVGRKPVRLEVRALPPLPLTSAALEPFLLGVASISLDFSVSSWLVRAELPFRLFFVEHYPTFGAEDNVLQVLDQSCPKSPLSVRFHVGLDEPLMSAFGGARVASLMEALGLEPGEKVEHPMIDKSLVNAQKKLGRRIPAPQPAESDVEWFARNWPST